MKNENNVDLKGLKAKLEEKMADLNNRADFNADSENLRIMDIIKEFTPHTWFYWKIAETFDDYDALMAYVDKWGASAAWNNRLLAGINIYNQQILKQPFCIIHLDESMRRACVLDQDIIKSCLSYALQLLDLAIKFEDEYKELIKIKFVEDEKPVDSEK